MELSNTKWMELNIVNMMDSLKCNWNNQVARKVLLFLLNFCEEEKLTLSSSCCDKLSNFTLFCLENISSLMPLLTDTFSEICKIVKLALKFEDINAKNYVIRDVLSNLVKTACSVLKCLSSDDGNHENMLRYLIIIEIILKSASVNETNDVIFCSVESSFEELISLALLSSNNVLITYSSSLLFTYCRNLKYTIIVQKIWLNIIRESINENCSKETFLIISSYFIESCIKRKELENILNSEEYWIALQLCLQSDLKYKKYTFNILKASVFNICNDKNCRNKHVSVWNCYHSINYQSWWKTYFVIEESIREKQTHLILPVFPLINNLINDQIVEKDFFWILELMRCGLDHDSRTIRIKTFFCVFDMKMELLNVNNFSFMMQMLLNAANDPELYRKLLKGYEFDNFSNKFIGWITNFPYSEKQTYFYKLLLRTLCEMKWSPIPLYYVMIFIVKSEITPRLDIEFGKSLNNIIPCMTRFHNTVIRSAIQCLFIQWLTRVYEHNSESLSCFFNILNNFNEDECLLRNVRAWRNIVDLLKYSIDFHHAENYVLGRIKNQIECNERSTDKIASTLARDVLLLHDAFEILEKSIIKKYFKEMIASFTSTLQKPYLNTKVQDNYLKLLVYMYVIVRNISQVKNCAHGSDVHIIRIIEENFIHIFTYVTDRMMKLENNLEMLDFYEFSINKLFECGITFCNEKDASLLNELLRKSVNNFNIRKAETTVCSMKIILYIWKLASSSHLKLIHYKNIRSIKFIIMEYFKETRPCLLQNFNNNIVSSYTDTFWNIIEIYLKNKYELTELVEVTKIFEIIFDTLDWIRKENLISVLKALKCLLSNEHVLQYEGLVFRTMDEIPKRLEEIETSPFYNDCFECWIQIFCQKSLLNMAVYHSKITEYIEEILQEVSKNGGQSYGHLILILNELKKIDNLFDIYSLVAEVLINIFCVTHINRKDQRMEYETIDHIRSLNDEISTNQIVKFDTDCSSEEMRLIALDIMLKLNQDEEKYINHCVQFIKILTIPENSSKNRYFSDSIFHRIKHKKLQLLLIFETILYRKVSLFKVNLMEYSAAIYHFTVNCLLVEPHQPSVRYMLEWLLVRLNVHYPSYFQNQFWNSFSEASEERMGSVCSFISVSFHLANIFQTEDFIDQAVKFILPWTMGQHFMARLYAQTVLMKLIDMNDQTKKKYEMVRRSLDCCLKKGNAVKNSLKMQQDFYFSHFRPIKHFSLQMILWDLPRLANLSREEWISEKLYLQYVSHESPDIPLFNSTDLFSQLTSALWISKVAESSMNGNDYAISETAGINTCFYETQKKFVPSNDLLSNADLNEPKRSCSNLVVVASLIDKAPNLGGLTRTCEIFSVSALIINDRSIIRSKEFASLSITAEKHVPLIEVKKQNLFNYLRKMKEEQFLIIGAEQTTNSENLNDFIFPVKSVILLGNEKEGIPANLLPVLDVCVEIPQMGVLRSLNVHVSASILIWEYSKQHLFLK